MPPDVQTVVKIVERVVYADAITPTEKLREVMMALIGGSADMSVPAFLKFLSAQSPNGDYRADKLEIKAVGQWRRGINIVPGEHLATIIDIYNHFSPGAICDALAAQVQIVRRRAAADKSGKVLRLFKGGDRSKVLGTARGPAVAEESGQIYSFWTVPTSEAAKGLDDFVRMSAQEIDIASAHDELTGHNRRMLYQRWLALEPRAFMSLRKYDRESGTTQVIAASIILPLTQSGSNRIITREVDAVALRDDEIGMRDSDPLTLLIDTWIVAPKKTGNSNLRRTEHDGFGGILLAVHAGLFWDGARDATVLVEPDNKKIALICEQLGFTAHGDCYAMRIVDGPRSPVFARRELAVGIHTVADWPIMNVRG